MKNVFSVPDMLLENGFYIEEDKTCDSTRLVLFKRDILIGGTKNYFQIAVTYTLSIYDDPKASYADNHYYYHEKTECLLHDENGCVILRTPFKFETFEDLETLERMFA